MKSLLKNQYAWLLFIILIGGYFIWQGVIRPYYEDAEQLDTEPTVFGRAESVRHLAFCGNELLDRPDVYERIGYEVSNYASTGFFSPHLLKKIERYHEPICAVLRANEVPVDLFFVAVVESHLSNAVSPAGALGFFQIMPQTAKHYGYPIQSLTDPVASAEVAAKILHDAYVRFGSWPKALAVYNAGFGSASFTLRGKQTYWDASFNAETSRYVAKVIAAKIAYEIITQSKTKS